MKRKLKEPGRDESGQALLLVVILLLVGTLIVVSLLGFMSTGLIAGQVFEKKMNEVYAADAGIEDAIWNLRDIERLKQLVEQLDENGYVPLDDWTPEDYNDWPLPSYDLTDPDDPDKPDDINSKGVVVTIDYLADDKAFKITSVATTDADSSTTVVSYLSSLDFSFFLDNAITSGGDVTIMPTGTPIDEVVEGNVVEDYSGDWPTAEQISAFYKSQVDTSDPYLAATWDVADNPIIGPLYRDGDLEIINTGTAGDSITLNGTVYVTGRLLIGTTNKDFILDLNGQTIFVEDDKTKPQEALVIGSKCTTITRSGCIIAVGDIDFQPKGSTDPDGFVFIMSVDGTVWFRPQGDFYGSIAGNVEVELWPGGTFYWRELEEDEDFNWPSGSIELLEIKTWEINPPG